MLYSFDGKKPTVGTGSYVSELAQVIGDVEIGENCYVGHGAVIRGDYGRVEVGNGTAVEEGVIIHAPPGHTQTIGANVTLGHGAILHGNSIGDYAVIGMGAITSLWSEVGEWTIIGEGGVVKMKQVVPDKVVAAGNPAKVIREVKQQDMDLWNLGKQVYVELAGQYLEKGMFPLDYRN